MVRAEAVSSRRFPFFEQEQEQEKGKGRRKATLQKVTESSQTLVDNPIPPA
jgi:hypothetical protein